MILDFKLEKHTVTLKSKTNKQPKAKIQTCTKYLRFDVYKILHLFYLHANRLMKQTQ